MWLLICRHLWSMVTCWLRASSQDLEDFRFCFYQDKWQLTNHGKYQQVYSMLTRSCDWLGLSLLHINQHYDKFCKSLWLVQIRGLVGSSSQSIIRIRIAMTIRVMRTASTLVYFSLHHQACLTYIYNLKVDYRRTQKYQGTSNYIQIAPKAINNAAHTYPSLNPKISNIDLPL